MHAVGFELLSVVLVNCPGASKAHRLARLQFEHLADDHNLIVEAAGICPARHKAQDSPASFRVVEDDILDYPFNGFLLHKSLYLAISNPPAFRLWLAHNFPTHGHHSATDRQFRAGGRRIPALQRWVYLYRP